MNKDFLYGLHEDQRGAVLAIALMIMVICSLLGAAAILTSTTEMQIARSERDYATSFNLADSGINWAKFQLIKTWGVDVVQPRPDPSVTFDVVKRAYPDGSVSRPEGGASVYLVESTGAYRRGSVVIQAQIRVPPPPGEEVSQGENLTDY